MPQGEAKDNKDVYTSSTLTKEGFASFDELRQNGLLCDVKIRVEDKEYAAHRLVLAGTCPYFRVMFTGVSCVCVCGGGGGCVCGS